MSAGNFLLLIFGLFLGLIGIFLSSGRFLCFLTIFESLNVLLLGCSLLDVSHGVCMCFVSILVMFTVEAVVALVVLVRVWGSGGLIGFFGW